jgi:AraC family transcriptional regulator of adaptative response/methylated-DNA-[protein]-cysteine methyltransferase
MKSQINIIPTKEWKGIEINYTFQPSIYGEVLIVSIQKGICYIGFVDTKEIVLKDLIIRFPDSIFSGSDQKIHKEAIDSFKQTTSIFDLVLNGTEFQLSI